MSLFITNTMSNKKEKFIPINEMEVGIYTCGPTVYDYAHIGNFRAYMFEDLLCRYLRFSGYKVKQIMNLTDIDDKTIRASMEKGITLNEYTQPYIDAFFKDLNILNIEPAEVYPRATEHIPEMVELIKKIRDNGHTYESLGSIYFRISSLADYGKLSGFKIDELIDGARIDSDEYDKENARDFVLWKAAKPNEPSWETELGKGRPGWHIECSAMSMKYLGETFDLHTGGIDNMFPHHENEIAQSESATGKTFAKYWMHCDYLIVDGQKMAKSLNNFYTLRDLLDKGYSARAIRYQLLNTHYRKQLNFTLEGLQQAASALQRFDDFLRIIKEQKNDIAYNKTLGELVEKTHKDFIEAMDDDLNISKALGKLFELIKETNQILSETSISNDNKDEIIKLFDDLDQVLGVLDKEEDKVLDEEIEQLIKEREEARKNKNYARSDEIRDYLKSKGIILEDTKDGTRWKRN